MRLPSLHFCILEISSFTEERCWVSCWSSKGQYSWYRCWEGSSSWRNFANGSVNMCSRLCRLPMDHIRVGTSKMNSVAVELASTDGSALSSLTRLRAKSKSRTSCRHRTHLSFTWDNKRLLWNTSAFGWNITINPVSPESHSWRVLPLFSAPWSHLWRLSIQKMGSCPWFHLPYQWPVTQWESWFKDTEKFSMSSHSKSTEHPQIFTNYLR